MSSGDQRSLEDNDEKKKKRFKNREEAVRFYATGVSLGLLLGSFTVFVFLIPFVLDPALATLQGDFSPAAAECRVVSSVYILGVSRWVDILPVILSLKVCIHYKSFSNIFLNNSSNICTIINIQHHVFKMQTVSFIMRHNI